MEILKTKNTKSDLILLSIIMLGVYLLLGLVTGSFLEGVNNVIVSTLMIGLAFSICFCLRKLSYGNIVKLGIYVTLAQIIMYIIMAFVPVMGISILLNSLGVFLGVLFFGARLVIIGLVIKFLYEKLKIPAFIFPIIFIVGIILMPIINLNSNRNDVKKFKNYLVDKYNLTLYDKYQNVVEENSALFVDVRDPSYVIIVNKEDSKINARFSQDLFNVRQEIYNYLKQVKGDNLIPDYLEFTTEEFADKGIIGYQVYLQDSTSIDEQLKSDYKIALYIKGLLETRYNQEFMGITVTYTREKKMLEKNWMDNYFSSSFDRKPSDENELSTITDRLVISSFESKNVTYKVKLNKYSGVDKSVYLENEDSFIKYAKGSYMEYLRSRAGVMN